jgi:hypothetical protein
MIRRVPPADPAFPLGYSKLIFAHPEPGDEGSAVGLSAKSAVAVEAPAGRGRYFEAHRATNTFPAKSFAYVHERILAMVDCGWQGPCAFRNEHSRRPLMAWSFSD